MASRFLLQNLPSRISSSRSRKNLSAHASAFATDAARTARRFLEGGTGTLNSLLQGSAAHRNMAIGSNTAIHRYEGRISTISNVLRGAACPSAVTHDNCGFRGNAARYFYTLPRSCPAANTSSPTTGMPSLTHHTKPACVGSVGVKPLFSSNSSTEKADFVPNSACKAEIEAAKKASDASIRAWKAELDKLTSSFDSLVTSLTIIWTIAAVYWIVRVYLASSRGGKGKRAQFAESDKVEVESPNVP